jgi:hypothetical protein
METNRNSRWLKEFVPSDDRAIDYLSRDGRTAVAVERASYGSRGLYSAVMQLALFLERNPQVHRACLVLNHTRMSLDRLKAEWKALQNVLRVPIARRLSIVVVEKGQIWTDPDESYVRRIAQFFDANSFNADQVQGEVVRKYAGQKSYEIVKVLIDRWLQRQGPIAIGELAEVVGCSFPTARKSLDKPSLRNALRFTSNRSVELTRFPHNSWNELLAFSNTAHSSFRFRDRSGSKTSPLDLLRRLKRLNPPHVALGGVVSARHWHKNFDLNGTPRLDLAYHAPDGKVDLNFVRRLDPALAIMDDPSESGILVVHPVVRASSLFVENSARGIPWADPVQTALDLSDLSLTVQANQLLTHLRPESRLA